MIWGEIFKHFVVTCNNFTGLTLWRVLPLLPYRMLLKILALFFFTFGIYNDNDEMTLFAL